MEFIESKHRKRNILHFHFSFEQSKIKKRHEVFRVFFFFFWMRMKSSNLNTTREAQRFKEWARKLAPLWTSSTTLQKEKEFKTIIWSLFMESLLFSCKKGNMFVYLSPFFVFLLSHYAWNLIHIKDINFFTNG